MGSTDSSGSEDGKQLARSTLVFCCHCDLDYEPQFRNTECDFPCGDEYIHHWVVNATKEGLDFVDAVEEAV